MAAILPANTNYTDLDFEALRARLQSNIRSTFPKWTATDVANFGNLLVELFAFVGDVLGYYQNQQGRESRWSTATQRKNLLALVKLIGFKPYGATAARVIEVFSITDALTVDLPIPVGTICRTKSAGSQLRFRLLAAVTIPAGQTEASGTVENSDAQVDSFTSTGLPNQQVKLISTPFLDASDVVSAGNGDYQLVDNFLASTAADRHYTITTDTNGVATLQFGNGTNGAIPVGIITVNYATGGGAVQVDAETITQLSGTFVDALGNPQSVSCSNPDAAQGGLPQQSVAQIKVRAPLSLTALTRTVGREDFETHATDVAGVARALMLTRNEDSAVGENTGYLYVLPLGGGTAGQALLDAVKNEVTVVKPCTITFAVNVVAAVYATVNITAVVYLASGAVAATVRQAITDLLTAFFAVESSQEVPNPNVDFGFNITKAPDGTPEPLVNWGKLFDAVSGVTGIRRLDPLGFQLNSSRTDLPIAVKEFPKLGSVTLVNGDTNLPL